MPDQVTVHRFRPPMGDNYQYILVHGDRGLVVDPFDEQKVIEECDALGVEPDGILLTHTHWDHVNGVQGFVRRFPVPVYVHPAGRDDVPDGCEIKTIDEGDRIRFGNGEVMVFYAPGHHPAHVISHWADTLLVGDVLFLAGCGNPNFGGDLEELYETVWNRVRGLDPSLRLAWGHDYADKNLRFALEVDGNNEAVQALKNEVDALRKADKELPWRTLAEELEVNPFFRCDQPEVAAGSGAGEGAEPGAVFSALRGKRDNF